MATQAWFALLVESSVNTWAELDGENLQGGTAPVGALALVVAPQTGGQVPLNGTLTVTVRSANGARLGGIPLENLSPARISIPERVPSNGDILVTPLGLGEASFRVLYRNPLAGYALEPVTVTLTVGERVFASGVTALELVGGPLVLLIDEPPIGIGITAQGGRHLPEGAVVRASVTQPACVEITTEFSPEVDMARADDEAAVALVEADQTTYTFPTGLLRAGALVPTCFITPLSIGDSEISFVYDDPTNGPITLTLP